MLEQILETIYGNQGYIDTILGNEGYDNMALIAISDMIADDNELDCTEPDFEGIWIAACDIVRQDATDDDWLRVNTEKRQRGLIK